MLDGRVAEGKVVGLQLSVQKLLCLYQTTLNDMMMDGATISCNAPSAWLCSGRHYGAGRSHHQAGLATQPHLFTWMKSGVPIMPRFNFPVLAGGDIGSPCSNAAAHVMHAVPGLVHAEADASREDIEGHWPAFSIVSMIRAGSTLASVGSAVTCTPACRAAASTQGVSEPVEDGKYALLQG